MALEKELKFASQDLLDIRNRLQNAQAVFENKYFECNQVFDTPNGDLKQADILLRLREADKNVLCLKRPPEEKQPSQVKVWEELETEVYSPEQMRSIYYALGYVTAFCYEKFREKWYLSGCKVCLDLLPFGEFVEIEGEIENISQCAKILELDMDKSSTKTYQQLNREYRYAKGLENDESFIFQEPLRSKLIEKETFLC